MSLATRCTACGTVFRVVQDQLKVSDGWVRCGRCDAVFDAAEGLFDLEREAPPPWSPTRPPGEVPAVGADDHRSRVDAGDPVEALRDDTDASPPAPPAHRDAIAEALARHADEAAGRVAPTAPPEAAPAFDDRSAPAAVEEPAGDLPTPTFRPIAPARRTTALLGGAALLLAVLLGAQVTARYSEIAFARWTGVQPVLSRWCAVTGCSVAAPRRIEEIVVESSALAPVIGTDALKLGLALRNRAGFAVAMPSVDLSLTDSGGRLIARRTLAPSDFRANAPALPPGAEVPLQALIAAGTAAVTGYTVEIFYP